MHIGLRIFNFKESRSPGNNQGSGKNIFPVILQRGAYTMLMKVVMTRLLMKSAKSDPTIGIRM